MFLGGEGFTEHPLSHGLRLHFHRRYELIRMMEGMIELTVGDRKEQLVERDNTQYVLMNSVSDYINPNYQHSLTLKDVAATLGYDYNYFSRLFHRTFGVGFKAYLNECRCGAAAKAIRTTDKSIANIAMDSSFQSIRTFDDVFQRYMGMSPAQYRKQLKHTQ